MINRETGIGVERPHPAAPSTSRTGSDAIASMLRALDFEFIALCPGASFRGLHDSLVNHLGNTRPEMLLVLHELYRSKEARDAALASGSYDGMGETFEQLDEVLVTLGAKGAA